MLARGHRALRPGDEGYELAAEARPESIPAEVLLRTKVPHGGTGTYHCVVCYRLDGRWFFDDPSARLGMHGGVDDAIRRRRARRKARRGPPEDPPRPHLEEPDMALKPARPLAPSRPSTARTSTSAAAATGASAAVVGPRRASTVATRNAKATARLRTMGLRRSAEVRSGHVRRSTGPCRPSTRPTRRTGRSPRPRSSPTRSSRSPALPPPLHHQGPAEPRARAPRRRGHPRRGHPVAPGLYLVAEVSEQALSPNMGGTEVGAVAIATAAMTAARAALNIRQRRQEQGKEQLVRELRDRLADRTLRERLQVVRDRMKSGQGLVTRFRDGEGPLRDRLFDHSRWGRGSAPRRSSAASLPDA